MGGKCVKLGIRQRILLLTPLSTTCPTRAGQVVFYMTKCLFFHQICWRWRWLVTGCTFVDESVEENATILLIYGPENNTHSIFNGIKFFRCHSCSKCGF